MIFYGICVAVLFAIKGSIEINCNKESYKKKHKKGKCTNAFLTIPQLVL